MDGSLEPTPAGWTFLTNHARVLAAISQDPGIRVRDLAVRCLLTERAVQRIIAELESDGYLTHSRVGRSNHYQIASGTILRHPADVGLTVADLLELLALHDAGLDGNGPARSSAGEAAPQNSDR